MKLFGTQRNLGILSVLALTVIAGACGVAVIEKEQASSVDAFSFEGQGAIVSVADLAQKPIGNVLKNPSLCKAFVAQSMNVGLWAGYTDSENKWGKARAKCAVKDGGTYCEGDDSVLWDGSDSSGMGMEVPRVFELQSTVEDMCTAAGRALGLVAGAPRSTSLGKDDVVIEHVSNLNASISGKSRSVSDVYVISVTSMNDKSNRRMFKKFYFASSGMPIGVRNSQEQNFNAVVQRQTAELHFLYPSSDNVIKEPRL